MRDDPTDARDPNTIWLRQSVTFTVNGQTRTLELALPLRPGATPDEVEAMLDEADAGMRRLSRRLDAHLSEIAGAPAASAQPASLSAPPSAPPPTPRAATPPASRATAPQPTPAARATPTPAAAERPAERPAPRPTTPIAATPAVAPVTAPAAAPVAGPDLTRPEFLTAVSALGLDARTVMERLNVRSLNGINLREALDLLRRQATRDGGSAPTATPAAPARMPAPIGAPRFDEEDDGPEFEVSYPEPDDLPGDDEFEGEGDFAPHEVAAAPAAAAASAALAPLSDVPDLEELLNGAAAAPAEDALTTRARAAIASLRVAHPGGEPTTHQRTAYKNIVIGQLGEAKATSVIRGVWDLTPDRIGPEHLDAFIRWGKEDDFAEEVDAALTILRAEYAARLAQEKAGAEASSSSKPASPEAPRRAAQGGSTASSAARPPAPRGRPATRDGSRGGA